MTTRVLFVDDEAEMGKLVQVGLRKRGLDVEVQTSGAAAFALLSERDVDVLVTDLQMPGMTGLELCVRVVANRPDVPVVVLTAFGSMETAVGAIRAGAYDFVTKPLDLDALELCVRRAAQHRALREEVRRLRQTVHESRRFDELIGVSAAMRELYDLLERVAATEATVLVSGESGTGKEMVARALHQRGKRAAGPFVAVNCAALPEALLESELFGHTRGAFTDVRQARPGLFLQASGGTLLLDEIGELPLGVQAKLLRALQDRRVRPVGGEHEVAFDARLICATNRDLEAAVEDERFREDLYYRINVIHVPLPPLRARGSDVLLLAQHFIDHFTTVLGKKVRGLSTAAAEHLIGYAWPGNVRELQNCIERAVALTRYEHIALEDLPEKIRAYQPTTVVLGGSDPAEILPLEEVEKRTILHAIEVLGGNRTLAAQKLGVDRKTLYRKLKAWGLEE